MWDSEQCGNSLKHPGQCLLVDIYHLVPCTSIERLGHRALTSRLSGETMLPSFETKHSSTCTDLDGVQISTRMHPNVMSILTLKDDHTAL